MAEHKQSPLTLYLQRLLLESGLSLERFLVDGLGYRTSAEGLEEYTKLLTYGCGTAGLIDKLKNYQVNPAALEVVLDQLQRLLVTDAETTIAAEAKREQRNFTPHICADYESISACDRRGSNPFEGIPAPTILIPPEASKLPIRQQLPLLKPLIQAHYAVYGQRTEHNERIDGYRAWLSLQDWDECEFYLFDTDGEHIPDEPAPWPKPPTKNAKRTSRTRQSKTTETKSRRK